MFSYHRRRSNFNSFSYLKIRDQQRHYRLQDIIVIIFILTCGNVVIVLLLLILVVLSVLITMTTAAAMNGIRK